jgi:streptogramin lyase
MLLLAGLHRASAQVYDWTTIAGMVGTTNSTDGVGSAARFNHPYSLAVDASGNVFVADTFNQLIRKLSPAGVNWTSSTIGSGSFSQGITVAPDGSVYLTDSASRGAQVDPGWEQLGHDHSSWRRLREC